MKSVHKVLKLRHKKHTGKLLPHKHTSYGVLFFLMLLPILMFAMVSQIASANDYALNAVVPAPLPSDGPVIVSPVNGTTFTASEIVVSGMCPTIVPPILVAVYDGAALAGSTQCTPAGRFVLSISMTVGPHTLVTKVVNFTGQSGASSPSVTVTRVLPAAPNVPNAPNSPNVPKQNNIATPRAPGAPPRSIPDPLIITNNQPVIVFGPNKDAVWRGSFNGGVTPYSIEINWGDGTIDKYVIADQTEQAFRHHYQKLGQYQVQILVKDSDGNTVAIRVIAASGAAKPAPATTKPSQDSNAGFVWPRIPLIEVYISSLMLLFVLWYIEHGRHKLRIALLATRPRRSGRI